MCNVFSTTDNWWIFSFLLAFERCKCKEMNKTSKNCHENFLLNETNSMEHWNPKLKRPPFQFHRFISTKVQPYAAVHILFFSLKIHKKDQNNFNNKLLILLYKFLRVIVAHFAHKWTIPTNQKKNLLIHFSSIIRKLKCVSAQNTTKHTNHCNRCNAKHK